MDISLTNAGLRFEFEPDPVISILRINDGHSTLRIYLNAEETEELTRQLTRELTRRPADTRTDADMDTIYPRDHVTWRNPDDF